MVLLPRLGDIHRIGIRFGRSLRRLLSFASRLRLSFGPRRLLSGNSLGLSLSGSLFRRLTLSLSASRLFRSLALGLDTGRFLGRLALDRKSVV